MPNMTKLLSSKSEILRPKSQIPSTKLGPHPEGGDSEGEITNKSQIPIINDPNRFGILKLGTRPQGGESTRSADNFGHCYLFVIWVL